MATKGKGYVFDAVTEPATVRLEMLPGRSVEVNGVLHFVEKQVVVNQHGKRVRTWVPGACGQFDAPTRIADLLTTTRGENAAHGLAPMAKVVKVLPGEQRSSPRRRAAGGEESNSGDGGGKGE